MKSFLGQHPQMCAFLVCILSLNSITAAMARPVPIRPFSLVLETPSRGMLPEGVKAPSLTLEVLLQRHLAALGGAAALTAVKSTKVTSDIEAGSIKGTMVNIYAMPDSSFTEEKLGVYDIIQGYDGKSAWMRGSNGNVRALSSEELKDLRVQIFFDTSAYVLPSILPSKMTLRPQTEVGSGNYIVDALPEGGKMITLFFDPVTYLITKEQHYSDQLLMTTTYSDYRTVDGLQIAFKAVTTNGTPRYDISTTITKIENNIPVLPSLFAPPTEAKKFSFIKPGQTRATVPFDLNKGEVEFQVRLNGALARVFLDSGAGGTALSQTTATTLGLTSIGVLGANGYGGSADIRPILINHLEVPGAITLSNVAAGAMDLPDIPSSYSTLPLAGIVGYDLLANGVVRVDYFRKTLTFIQSDSFHPTARDGVMLPLEMNDNIPTIEAQIDSLPAARFMVDTGDANGGVRLYGPYVNQNGLDKKYPGGAITSGTGIGGASFSRITPIRSFTLAGMTFHNPLANFSLDTQGGASQVKAGALGSQMLSQFIVTFDYPHSRIFLAPAPKVWTSPIPLKSRVSGMATKSHKAKRIK